MEEAVIQQTTGILKKGQINLRNLVIKIFLSNINQDIDNLDESFHLIVDMISKQSQDNSTIANKNQEQLQIEEEMEIFVDQLKQTPQIWMSFICKNRLKMEKNKIILNLAIVITEVFEKLLESVNQRITEKRKLKNYPSEIEKTNGLPSVKFNFRNMYFDESSIGLTAMVLSYFAEQIVQCFDEGKVVIVEEIQVVEKLIKNLQIMNTYILFALLKQMSRLTYQKIKQIFQSSFPNISEDVTHNFCRYVQQHYEMVHLHYEEKYDYKIFTVKQMKNYNQGRKKKQSIHLLKRRLSEGLTNNCKFKEAVKQDKTEIANQILAQTFEEISKDGDLNKQINKWSISDIKKTFNDVFNLFKKQIKDGITASADQQIANDILFFQPTSSAIGGELGKCLVDIDNYESTNEFFVYLSKNALVGKSISFMLEEVPILNYFIVAGGLSYTVYVNYKDEIASSLTKMKNIGKASVLAVGSVGTAVTGIILGEIMIPIPFLGAFVGGVIGGYFGEKGNRFITSILSNNQLISLISYLKRTLIENDHWKYTGELLGKLGVSKKYFENSISIKVEKHDAYITTLCFCVVTYYESREHIQQTQKKVAEQNKMEKQVKGNIIQKKQEIKRLVHNQKQLIEQFGQNQFDIVAIVQYLTENQINLSQQLQKLEQAILHIAI